ncbi:hypothetical protein EJ07DRAFT_121853 [Lizonia empirigonia]|nr:hypothetical protein EJ07DRAFT_121853 [Lizonia empirigonia]
MLSRSAHRHVFSRLSSISHRSFHRASAQFVTTDAQGCLKECAVPIQHGDLHEAYVLIPPHVGNAFSAACAHQKLSHSRADTLPLTFDHTTKSFTCTSTLLPRLAIAHELPSKSDTLSSPATLYLFGATHTIALDGTSDGTVLGL